MPLPRKAKQQLDQAEALLQRMNAPQDETPAPETPAPEPVVAEQPTEPEAVASPAPAPTPSPEPQIDRDLEQKYKTLQGIHRSLNDRVKAMEQRNQELEERLQQALRRVEERDEPRKPEPSVDPKDAEVFGEDLVQMVQRVAQTMFGSAVKSFDARLASIEQQLKGTTSAVAKTAEDVFYEKLRGKVADFEEINVDPRFLEWLAETDPVYGEPRQAALTRAANAMDGDRVANVFLAFKATLTPSQTPAQKPAASDLEKQVAPNSVATPPAQPQGKRAFTIAEVEAFYRDVAQGKYRGREAEANKFEAQINAAIAEGRVTDRPMRAAA